MQIVLPAPFSLMPFECNYRILSFLSPFDLCRTRRVNKAFKIALEAMLQNCPATLNAFTFDLMKKQTNWLFEKKIHVKTYPSLFLLCLMVHFSKSYLLWKAPPVEQWSDRENPAIILQKFQDFLTSYNEFFRNVQNYLFLPH